MIRKIRNWLDKWRGGRETSRGENFVHGRFCVLYPDGQRSEPMYHSVAKAYAEIFKGKVYWVGPLESEKPSVKVID